MSDKDNLLNKKSPEEIFYRYCGEILSGATEIEKALCWKLRIYFFPKSNIKSTIFFYNILNAHYFDFERKIELYKKIPYFKKSRSYSEILESLRFVQKIRNQIAHWEVLDWTEDSDKIIIYDPITFKKRRLDVNLMKEFALHDRRLLKYFGWHFELQSKYGVKKRNIINKRTVQIREVARLISNYPKLKEPV